MICRNRSRSMFRPQTTSTALRPANRSAAMSVAALLKHPDRFAGRKVVLVVCGRNIDLERFRQIIDAGK